MNKRTKNVFLLFLAGFVLLNFKASNTGSNNNRNEQHAPDPLPDRWHEPPAMNNKSKVYFLHIPKTAGTSLVLRLKRTAKFKGFGPWGDVRNFSEWASRSPGLRVFSSEGVGFHHHKPRYTFTMVRDPVAHVVSQYHHCKESKTYKQKNWTHTMPDTMLEWLRGWDRLQQEDPRWWNETIGGGYRVLDPKYNCIVPLDLQSFVMGFPKTKRELSSVFFAVGLTSEFDKSFCMFMSHIEQRVPSYCNCTSGIPPVALTAESMGYDHGVKHHGASYVLSEEERSLVEKFTQKDRKVYELVKEEFGRQVTWVENKFSAKLCDGEQQKQALQNQQNRQKQQRTKKRAKQGRQQARK